ncbi:hypothetical protein CYMTET_41205 [Cymbomonas tetramitiformis]|uniref:Uncharacterized protein n=1 Tax=Cymbomonas tetramitiformis TaxID=36881 RepID=A0AAE0C8C3_9CHLO|nr:hypothetical protein CYMTET_41205 [Cymbomonas tetramitiformis]
MMRIRPLNEISNEEIKKIEDIAYFPHSAETEGGEFWKMWKTEAKLGGEYTQLDCVFQSLQRYRILCDMKASLAKASLKKPGQPTESSDAYQAISSNNQAPVAWTSIIAPFEGSLQDAAKDDECDASIIPGMPIP